MHQGLEALTHTQSYFTTWTGHVLDHLPPDRCPTLYCHPLSLAGGLEVGVGRVRVMYALHAELQGKSSR